MSYDKATDSYVTQTTYAVPTETVTTTTYQTVPVTTSYAVPPTTTSYNTTSYETQLQPAKTKLTGDTTAPSGYALPPVNVAPYESKTLGIVATGETTYQAPGYQGSVSAGGYQGVKPPEDPTQSAPPPVYQAYYDQTKLDRSPAIYSTESNAPINYTMSDKWVVVGTTEPLRMFCPYDNDWTTTHCERAPGGMAMLACCFLWCFCWPCMLLPCLMPTCWDELHRCDRCGNILAVKPAGAQQGA